MLSTSAVIRLQSPPPPALVVLGAGQATMGPVVPRSRGATLDKVTPPLPHVTVKADAPPATQLPSTTEPAAASDASTAPLTPGQEMTSNAMAGNPIGILQALAVIKGHDGAGMTEFVNAMANALGMSPDDASLLCEAMSRGGYDAKALAEGVNALRSMSPSERRQWLATWLPAARDGANAIIAMTDNSGFAALGAQDGTVAVLVELAGATAAMTQRNAELPKGTTLQDVIDDARAKARSRLDNPHGSKAILGEVAQLGSGDKLDQAKQQDLVNDLAARYGISDDVALAMLDAMRTHTDVGNMIADGLNALERLGDAKAPYVSAFFASALSAIGASDVIAGDPFKQAAGPTDPSEVQPIADFKDLIYTMGRYGALLAKQAKAAADAKKKAEAVAAA